MYKMKLIKHVMYMYKNIYIILFHSLSHILRTCTYLYIVIVKLTSY